MTVGACLFLSLDVTKNDEKQKKTMVCALRIFNSVVECFENAFCVGFYEGGIL